MTLRKIPGSALRALSLPEPYYMAAFVVAILLCIASFRRLDWGLGPLFFPLALFAVGAFADWLRNR